MPYYLQIIIKKKNSFRVLKIIITQVSFSYKNKLI